MTRKTLKEIYAQLGAGLTLHDDLETHSKPEEEIKRTNGGQADQQQVEEQQSEQEGKPPVRTPVASVTSKMLPSGGTPDERAQMVLDLLKNQLLQRSRKAPTDGCGSAGDDVSETTDGDDLAS